jgi:hypothetical protein
MADQDQNEKTTNDDDFQQLRKILTYAFNQIFSFTRRGPAADEENQEESDELTEEQIKLANEWKIEFEMGNMGIGRNYRLKEMHIEHISKNRILTDKEIADLLRGLPIDYKNDAESSLPDAEK